MSNYTDEFEPEQQPRRRPQANSRYTPPKPRTPVGREAARMDGEQPEPTPIDWGGVTLLVPDPDDMDIDVVEAFENGRAVDCMRQIFGANTFASARREFEEINGHRPKVRDLNTLADAVFEIWGIDRGE